METKIVLTNEYITIDKVLNADNSNGYTPPGSDHPYPHLNSSTPMVFTTEHRKS